MLRRSLRPSQEAFELSWRVLMGTGAGFVVNINSVSFTKSFDLTLLGSLVVESRMTRWPWLLIDSLFGRARKEPSGY